MVIEVTRSRSRIVHRLLPENDPRQLRPVSRASELLAWAPHVSLKDGLGRTIGYFERLLSEKGVLEAIVG
jgi:UDP-glucuronate decarboxylase